MTNEIDLLKTVLELKKQKYPDLPVELVQEIVEAESSVMENRKAALRTISNIIERYVVTEEKENAED